MELPLGRHNTNDFQSAGLCAVVIIQRIGVHSISRGLFFHHNPEPRVRPAAVRGFGVPERVSSLTNVAAIAAGNRILVPSPKTEHHAGGESRLIPLFPELLKYLQEVYFRPETEGTEYVINRYRDTNCNLRSQFERIIRKAGLKPWPKLFYNLRAMRETELAETWPGHVVCKWIGNTEKVAREHYPQVTDEHYERAAKPADEAAQKAAQYVAESIRMDENEAIRPSPDEEDMSLSCENLRDNSPRHENSLVSAVGLEPTTHGLKGNWPQVQPIETQSVTNDAALVCSSVCMTDTKTGIADDPDGAESGGRNFAEAVAAIMRLPLADTEKAEAGRRLLAVGGNTI